MNLTPFGFVCRAQTFVKDALSMPPRGGGQWSTQRLVNFMDHTGSLHILLDPGTGVVKPSAIMRARSTGSPRDAGIQGWVEYPATDSREAFVLRENIAERSEEEIFDIVEKVLSKIPEWDNSASFQRPEPPPRVFEPLIPEIQKPTVDAGVESAPASEEAPTDMQSLVDSLLSPENFDAVPSEPAEPVVEAAAEPEPAAEPAAAAEPLVVEEAAPEEETAKPAKKAGRAKKAKG